MFADNFHIGHARKGEPRTRRAPPVATSRRPSRLRGALEGFAAFAFFALLLAAIIALRTYLYLPRW